MAVPGEVTDRSAVVETEWTLEVEGHAVDVAVAAPARGASVPGLLVVHEAFGVNDHIRDVCRRFAAQGFLAAAPDLLARVGGPPREGADPGSEWPRIFSLPDREAVADMRAVVGRLRSEAACNGRVGAIGFCMGGRLSLLLATQPGVLDAAVTCWGGRITARTAIVDERHPEVVVDRVGSLSCPLLGVFGENDQNPNAADVAELVAALEREGKEHRIVVYPDAGHALFADYRPQYVEKAAFAAWDEFLGFLVRLR